jgi:ubiquinone/menaquinone biosynthesis C-methylase UbiE
VSESRGEASFLNLPSFGAGMYDKLMGIEALRVQYREIALDLVGRIEGGCLLDIGTGPGRLLLEIYRLKPDLELFGLDISEAMVAKARVNLEGVGADLRQGNIRCTNYPDAFFDLITTTGSFYLWDQPETCLAEIYRILKPGTSAYLYESHKDCDEAQLKAAVKLNLRGENLLRKLIMPGFIRRQLAMFYRMDELHSIFQNSLFADQYAIDEVVLARLPIWVRIRLTKSAERG